MRNNSVYILISIVAPLLFQSCVRLAITDTNLFDPVIGSMLPNRTILVHNEHIVAIGEPGKPIKVPANVHVIDGSDKYVIPGWV